MYMELRSLNQCYTNILLVISLCSLWLYYLVSSDILVWFLLYKVPQK